MKERGFVCTWNTVQKHRGKGIIGFASEKKITHTAVHARHAPRASYLVVVSS